jgi:hypothetical protein
MKIWKSEIYVLDGHKSMQHKFALKFYVDGNLLVEKWKLTATAANALSSKWIYCYVLDLHAAWFTFEVFKYRRYSRLEIRKKIPNFSPLASLSTSLNPTKRKQNLMNSKMTQKHTKNEQQWENQQQKKVYGSAVDDEIFSQSYPPQPNTSNCLIY